MADSDLPLILEPDELERRLGRPGLLVVDLGAASTHARQHVPGAAHLDYARIVAPRRDGGLPVRLGYTDIIMGSSRRDGRDRRALPWPTATFP